MYKPLKYVDNVSNVEMSADGGNIRYIDSQKEIPIVKNKAVFLDDSGKEKKLGLKTCYWKTFNKPFGTAINEPSVIRKRKTTVKDNKRQWKQILPKATFNEIQEYVRSRTARSLAPTGATFRDNKNYLIRLLVFNQEKNMLVIRISSADWRDGYSFLDISTFDVFKAFNKDKDKKYGDKSIQWPTAS